MTHIKSHLLISLLVLVIALTGCTTKPDNVAISADGLEIRFDVQGEGEPVLIFVHGWCCDRSYWKAQVPYFSQKYKVVAIDLAGHGESGLERAIWSMEAFGKDVAAVVEHLGLKKVVLIGHSMGGPVVLEAARQLPTRTMMVVGVDTYERAGETYSQEVLDEIFTPFRTNFAEATSDFVRSSFFTPTTDPALIEQIAKDMSSAPPTVGIGAAEEMLRYSNEGCYERAFEEISTPIHCINTETNQLNLTMIQPYASSFEVEYMSGVGHFVMMEDPDTFNRLLEEIVESIKVK